MSASPQDQGRVVMLCSRLRDDMRWLPSSMEVDAVTGFPQDRWHWGRAQIKEKYKECYGEMQVATMEASVAKLVANGQPLFLSGDNLFLDLDLSRENLPSGSRLRIGGATFEATPYQHRARRGKW